MFGEIRSILKQAPSPDRWEALCTHISALSFEQVAQIMPYVLSHLTAWPDALRVAPLRWRDGLVRGATLPFAPMVRVLDAHGMNLRNEDMLTFSRSSVIPHLRALSLRQNPVSWRGLGILVEQGVLGGLGALDVEGTLLGGSGMKLLAEHMSAGGLPHLEQLCLGHTGVDIPSVLPLLEANTRGKLHAMTMRHNGLHDPAMLLWFGSEASRAIHTLDLGGNPITGHALMAARRLGWTRAMTWLGMQDLGLSATGVLPLLRGQDWPTLHTLDLRGNQVARSLAVLAEQGEQGGFPALTALGLCDTGASIKDVIALIEGLRNLQELAIDAPLRTPEAIDFAQEHGVALVANLPTPWLVP